MDEDTSEPELTLIGRLIMAEDIGTLDASLGREWKLNREADFGPYSDLPINFAIAKNKLRILDYLLSKGADLNVKGNPAIMCAVDTSDTAMIDKLLKAGARIDAVNNVGSNAYSRALYSERLELLPFLLPKGLRVDADHGKSLRQAVSNRQRAAVEFFLEAGIDPDLCSPDQVFPYNPTAVTVAADNDDFDMVRLLVDHGANVTLRDDYGNRPFLAAVRNKNVTMQSFLRALEPSAWHDSEKRIDWLRGHHVTEDLIEYLQRAERRIQVNSRDCTWLDFHPLLHVPEMTWFDDTYLSLVATVDDECACGALAWSSRERQLVIIDLEHDEIIKLGSWAEFIGDPAAQISKQWA